MLMHRGCYPRAIWDLLSFRVPSTARISMDSSAACRQCTHPMLGVQDEVWLLNAPGLHALPCIKLDWRPWRCLAGR